MKIIKSSSESKLRKKLRRIFYLHGRDLVKTMDWCDLLLSKDEKIKETLVNQKYTKEELGCTDAVISAIHKDMDGINAFPAMRPDVFSGILNIGECKFYYTFQDISGTTPIVTNSGCRVVIS